MISVPGYVSPKRLDEALDILSLGEHSPIAGGTDLLLQLRNGRPRKLLDLSALGLDFIRRNEGAIEIGSTAVHATIASSQIIGQYLPALSKASSLVGSQQIRNRGTVGGNIVNASPCADTIAALLLYDAQVVLKSSGGDRILPLSEFVIKPYVTLLKPEELLHSIICMAPAKKQGWSYIKLGRRRAVNISRMTIAVTFTLDNGNIANAAISAGSVFPTPSRMPRIERMLDGQRPSRGLLWEAANAAAKLMIRESGNRWSTPYKEPVITGLLSRALDQAQQMMVVSYG